MINGDYADLLIALSTDQLVSMLKLGTKGNVIAWIGVELTNRAFFSAMKQHYYHGSKPILSEEREGNKIYVTINPNNINDSETPVLLGLSTIKNPSDYTKPNYTKYDKRSNLVKINSTKNEYEFEYDFQEIGNYHIVPFIISQEIIQEYNTEFVREWFVEYGLEQVFTYPTITITNVKKVLCGEISDDEIAFRLNVDLSLEAPKVLSHIGTKVINSKEEVTNVIKLVSNENTELNLSIEGKLSSKALNASGKVLLHFYPYGQREDECVYGKVYEYILSLSDVCTDNNHPHFIDLGLPSGTLWCCMNAGGTEPTDFGDYYLISKAMNISGIMGDGYSTPSKVQFEELLAHTTQCRKVIKNVSGMYFQAPNGNAIFMPAAAQQWWNSSENRWEINNAGSGAYWTVSQSKYDGYYYFLEFNDAESAPFFSDRNGTTNKLPVRVVCKK